MCALLKIIRRMIVKLGKKMGVYAGFSFCRALHWDGCMTLVIEKVAATIVASVKGLLDPIQAAQIETSLLAQIDKGERRVVLDFSGMNLASQPGIRTVLLLDRLLRHHDGRLVVCNMTPDVRAAFGLCGALSLLTVTATRTDAMGVLA